MTRSGSAVSWKQVWAVFEETIARPPGHRRAYLESATGGDESLRAAVERMLEADKRASPLLDMPVARPPELVPGGADGVDAEVADAGAVQTAEDSQTRASEAIPETLGAYRLVRQIGQGGMSTVYLAVREDDAFHRKVVVKVVRRDLESPYLRRRLRAERQILAGLTHPNIARLYDGGATADGCPYFVMEHVEGQPIDLYCQENRLRVAERLVLFRKICDAVGYAHQNLVIHRDLKPSNILATPDGEPRLLDFGIAKLSNPDLVGDGLEPTATWQRALTPSYASPEQIRGQRTTTASDVYSLGVVLYQLLTGSLPFDFSGRSPSEIERLVTETEPTRPSLAVRQASEHDSETGHGPSDSRRSETPSRLGDTLAGDLDAIVLKALRSTPRERYGSVEQLAADIDRYLAGLPVSARQGNFRYRAAKFARRHRTAVITGSAIAVLLVAFASSMSWQAAKTARERDQARLERDRKQQVASLVREIFDLSNPYVVPGSELTVREAVERSVPLLDARLTEQPALRAELLHTSGAILGAVDQHEVAERQLREALRLRRTLLPEGHPDVLETMDLLAYQLAALGKLDEAETLARAVLAEVRGTASADSAELVDPLIRLASILCFRSELDGAERAALESLSLARSLPASDLQEALSYEYLGVVESARGAYDKAASHQRMAVAVRRALHGENHPLLVNPLSNLGLSLRRSGDLAGSAAVYQELIEVQRFNFGADFIDPQTTVNLAGLQVALGDFPSAESLYEQALAELGGPTSDHPGRLHTELRLAHARVLNGKPAQAEVDLRRILGRARDKLGPDHWRIAQAESLLGASLGAQGRHAEAEPLLVGGFERLVGSAKERYLRDSFDHLRRYLEARGRGDEVAAYESMMARD